MLPVKDAERVKDFHSRRKNLLNIKGCGLVYGISSCMPPKVTVFIEK